MNEERETEAEATRRHESWPSLKLLTFAVLAVGGLSATPSIAGDLDVSVSQTLLAVYEMEDGRSQAEIEFVVTNHGGDALYDLRVVALGCDSIPIDPPKELIRIDSLEPSDHGTVAWAFDLHSRPVANGTLKAFGRIEAVDVATGEILFTDFGLEGAQ